MKTADHTAIYSDKIVTVEGATRESFKRAAMRVHVNAGRGFVVTHKREVFAITPDSKLAKPVRGDDAAAVLYRLDAYALAQEPATLPARAKFTSTPTTQRVLLAGLDCAPGQADLFSTDGTN